VAAGEIERFIVDQIRAIGKDPGLVAETLSQAGQQGSVRLNELESELNALERDLGHWNTDVRKLTVNGSLDETDPAMARLADLQERIRVGEFRVNKVRDAIGALEKGQVSREEVAQALAAFDPVWESLTPQEQARLVQLLIERVDYDGARGKIAITFHATGIKTLAQENINHHQEKSA